MRGVCSMDSRNRYLRLLAQLYPTSDAVCMEIISLQSILSLPKGTEHFLSDIHGEYEAFNHVLRNASGIIRSKLERLFEGELSIPQIRDLATLIYYPTEKMENLRHENGVKNWDVWYEKTLHYMIRLCRYVSEKYTRIKVRKMLPQEFAHVIDELLYEQHGSNKQAYYTHLITTIIELDQAEAFIVALAELIQCFSVDHLHILGDVFDRGPGAHLIMDTLMNYHQVDVQWGNHDILWMGAASGSEACIANVLRISFRYGNLTTLEQGYGISLRPLSVFALRVYADDSCDQYYPRNDCDYFSAREKSEIAKMHKAILVIQLKLEGMLIRRRKDWELEDRLLLNNIDYERGTIVLEGKEYSLTDNSFPTIDPQNPYWLTDEELEVVRQLRHAFCRSEKLQAHTRFLFAHGSMYLCMNDNVLYHGCIPLDEDGTLKNVTLFGESLQGRALLDHFDQLARQGYFSTEKQSKKLGEDSLWYLWSGAYSPLFAKKKMAIFENYFILDKEASIEQKNPYYAYRDTEAVCDMILQEFGLNPQYSHIVNGHVPVLVKKGESPTKSNGKLMVIDGGFSKAYQGITGIGGYTLIYNSWGMSLISHEPFSSTEKAIKDGTDIVSTRDIVEYNCARILIRDTDHGASLQKKICELRELLSAYRSGIITEGELRNGYS